MMVARSTEAEEFLTHLDRQDYDACLRHLEQTQLDGLVRIGRMVDSAADHYSHGRIGEIMLTVHSLPALIRQEQNSVCELFKAVIERVRRTQTTP